MPRAIGVARDRAENERSRLFRVVGSSHPCGSCPALQWLTLVLHPKSSKVPDLFIFVASVEKL